MARRRKLTAPSAEDLNRLEDEFRRETAPRGAMAPIAQVAAEAAQSVPTADTETRTRQAKLESTAKAHEEAQEKGLLISQIPIEEIAADDMIRDRAVINEHEMTELRLSISANGMRLPIEVYELSEPSETGARYGLLSGYRRLLAVRGLRELTGQGIYATIKALIRPATDSAAAFAAMVEENEIRANLSHFERGRIAVIAAQNGAFTNTGEAVDALFASASKAKRSKVRSFAQIFEDLGDMLSFPEMLIEKQGLRIAAVLRSGGESQLREALAEGSPEDAEAEWQVLLPVLERFEEQPKDTSRGGRPSRKKQPSLPGVIDVAGGVRLTRTSDSRGYSIRIEGKYVDGDMVDAVMLEIQSFLEKRD